MSQAGRKKKQERLIKRTSKDLCTPYENMSPGKQKQWDEGANRILVELRKRKDRP